MTDTDGLLRDAGGARPRDDLDGLIERLKGRAQSWQIWIEDGELTEFGYSPDNMKYHQRTDNDAAAALVQLREQRDEWHKAWIGMEKRAERAEARFSNPEAWMKWCDVRVLERAERAEAEVARLKDRVEQRDKQIAVYNSGGFADADALAESVIELTARIAALEAERDAIREPTEEMIVAGVKITEIRALALAQLEQKK